jgi:hypothetical protein
MQLSHLTNTRFVTKASPMPIKRFVNFNFESVSLSLSLLLDIFWFLKNKNNKNKKLNFVATNRNERRQINFRVYAI